MSTVGSVVSIWRYPVKSMMGEELDSSEVTSRGLRGDRAYALVDRSDGKVATAKNPRKWPNLFALRAVLAGRGADELRITLPGGRTVTGSQSDVNELLSGAVGRDVRLENAAAENAAPAVSENYWPDMDGLDHRDTVTEFTLPKGTFFDCAVVNLLTTGTLDRLGELYPQGRFEPRRFRPNILVAPADGATGFVESSWIGRALAIGDVRLRVTRACARCVMTTLPQDDLPADPGILRTVARHNQAKAGVYAAVVRGGTIRREDPVELEA